MPWIQALSMATALVPLPATAIVKTANATAYPILSFDRYEPIAASLITARSVEHRVTMANDAFQIVSTWTIENTLKADEFLFGSDADQGAKIDKIRVNGVDAPFTKISGHEGYVRINNVVSKTSPNVNLIVTSTLPLDGPKDDLKLLSTFSLPKPGRLVKSSTATGWDLRSLNRHSYGDPVKTTLQISTPPGWLVVGSSPVTSTTPSTFHFQPLVSARFVAVLAPKSSWRLETCAIKDLECTLMAKQNGAHLSAQLMQPLLAKVSKPFVARFGRATDHLVLVDSDWDAISGGLLGSNVLAFFAQSVISPEQQSHFKDSFGWEPRGSTSAYVAELYKHARDPWDAYMTGMLAHEFAHLYFGFGHTSERIVDLHELWFSLGLGLLYDEIITNELLGRRDAFFQAVETNWRTQFANNKSIDQRLVKPDTSKDQAFRLSRAHVYAHGKALAVLRALRERVGADAFDRAVVNYLAAGCSKSPCTKNGDHGGYSVFRKHLMTVEPGLKAIEKELEID